MKTTTPRRAEITMELRDKVAVVTGAASGIGRAIAEVFAAEGAAVVVGDLAPGAGDVAAGIGRAGGRALFVRTDVTDEDSVAALMAAAVAAFGGLDVLVANAGIAEKKAPVHEMALPDWQKVIDINLTGVALSNKHAIAHMVDNGGGAIVNMGSILAHVGQVNSTAYSAAKAGVVNLTRSTAVTYARQGIRANAISPGYVRTPLVAGLPADVRAGMVDKQPIGRLAEPEEIAQVALFLASGRSSFVTGTCVHADGGYTAL
jgi:NAD(P)-dependent dehydrogenase (short-subunit alcohol dehydrogenase family)